MRCLELGLSLSELDLLTVGMVYDMAIEKGNDSYDYPLQMTQEDYDAF
nr:MAG TPA: hypothetical protein [Caudoviricetes sp.]